MKSIILALLVLTVTGCASVPMNRDVLLAHAERNCRVEASVNKAYAIDSTGVSMQNVAYRSCMARRTPR